MLFAVVFVRAVGVMVNSTTVIAKIKGMPRSLLNDVYPGPYPEIRNGGCKIIGRGVWGPLKAPGGPGQSPGGGAGGGGAKPPGSSISTLINKHILAFRIVGVKTNYSPKEIGFFLFCFEKGGAHTPVAPPPPPATALLCIYSCATYRTESRAVE